MSEAKNPISAALQPADLIRKYQDGIWRYLRVLGCQPSEAYDLTQETFMAAIQKDFQHFGEAATKGYLRKIAFNFFISYQRRQGRMVPVEDIEALDQGFGEWVRDDSGGEALDRLRECLSRLGERAKSALEMRFRDQMSRAEIADRLGISEHGAKNLMQRAKDKLRDCIDEKSQLNNES
jgi:RNA polymerase sigma-70 factor, ECF subfamily